MAKLKKLPDAEFAVMKVIWQKESPISTSRIIEFLPQENNWKPQTVLTLLVRLIDRGFLKSEKRGRERYYYPLIEEDEYLRMETEQFVSKYHENSITGLISAFYNGKKMSEKDLRELKDWVEERSR